MNYYTNQPTSMGAQNTRVLGKVFEIQFRINIKVQYGQRVYAVGNIKQLGQWKIRDSLGLCWKQGHQWSGLIQIDPSPLFSTIEFKYVIGDWNEPQNGDLEWQAGQRNRKIDLCFPMKSIICENVWNMEKVYLNLIVPNDQFAANEFSVLGNCRELGCWKNLVSLRQRETTAQVDAGLPGKFENPENYKIYSAVFEIFRGKKKKQQKIRIQKFPGRKYDLQKDHHTSSKCFKILHPAGNTQIFQICDFDEFTYSKVTPRILMGSLIRKAEDCQLLKKEGVTLILSIEIKSGASCSERKKFEEAQEICRNEGLIFYHISVSNLNNKDSMDGVSFIKNLATKGGTIYIQCCSNPSILKLMIKQNLTFKEAASYLEEKGTPLDPILIEQMKNSV